LLAVIATLFVAAQLAVILRLPVPLRFLGALLPRSARLQS
jgi:hypothetical protein